MSKGRRLWRGGAIVALGLAGLALQARADEIPAGPSETEIIEKSIPSAPGADGLFDAAGYRLKDYRAPVPAIAPGAQTVTLAEVQALQAAGAVLIDVMGAQRFHIDAAGRWITPPGPGGGHLTIPGAIWLPVVGWGELEPWQEDYLRQSLADLTAEDPARPIVVFCKTDCWLSWNAARRIAGMGLKKVCWFPGGSDDWTGAGMALTRAHPWPLRSGPDRPFAP